MPSGGTQPFDPHQTMVVYRDGKGMFHLPSRDRDSPMVMCGLDVEWMERRDHPISHAGLWCSFCMRTATGMAANERL